ncbi:short-chain dehydrogenase [Pestalotiopsis sp. NC0098]|nr:short-chain dehydrogenase [Pestalotiopsis sp. NC0098]
MQRSREGFTIDVAAKFARRTVFNPVLAITAILVQVSILFHNRMLDEKSFQHLSGTGWIWSVIASLWATIGISIWTNGYLNDGYANNWSDDDTWDFEKEIVLITGASSGIGASVSQCLLRHNPQTTIVILDFSPMSWTPPPGTKIHYYQCDLSHSSVIKLIAEKVRKEVGNPTILVNNAGLSRGFTVMEGSYADVELTMRTNLIAPFLLTKEFLPHMVQHDHGHILNISSMSSIMPPAGIADYAATKAGINALHEALQLELKNIHQAPRVRLSLGIFSFIRTPLFKGETGLSNFMYPVLHVDTVGETLADILLRGRGETLYMPGMMRYLHLLRFLPEWLLRIARQSSQGLRVDFKGRQKIDARTGGLSTT